MNHFYPNLKVAYILFACAFLGILAPQRAMAQLSGSYSVPTNYTTIAGFVSALNTAGVGTGGVTLNVAAGHTETLTSTIVLTATGTMSNPIIIQKSGTGANPIITSFTNGTGTPGLAAPDGLFALAGSDYVTINGIDLAENAANTANPATMEYGYGLFRTSAIDACQNVTIKNCTISLSNQNNASGSGPMFNGSVGITMISAKFDTATTVIVPTATSGAARNNSFTNNYIQNVNIGIGLNGYNQGTFTSYALQDSNNVIGGASGFGNQIYNFGGASGATNPSSGIQVQAQHRFNVSYNTLNNNNGSGTNHPSTLRGIFCNASAQNASGAINNNTLTIGFGGTTSSTSVIENSAGVSGAGNTITINNNTITNCSSNSSATGIWYGIYNTASVSNLEINGNTFSGNSHQGASGTNYCIYSTGAVNATNSIQNNTIQRTYNGTAAYTGTFYGIYNTGGTTSTTANFSGNTFGPILHTVTGTGSLYMLYNSSSQANVTFNGNSWTNATMNHSGSEYFIYNASSTQIALVVSNNTINNVTRTAASGTFYCYYAGSSSLGTSTQDFFGNTFSNISSATAGTGTFYGLYSSDGSSTPYPRKSIYNNTLSNINYNTTGTCYPLYMSYLGDGSGTSGSAIYNNTLNNITTSGTLYALYATSTASPNYQSNVYGNTIDSITTNANTSNVAGAYIGGNTTQGVNFYQNKITNVTANGTGNLAHGVNLYTTGIYNVYNNIIGHINAPTASSTNSVNGIYVTSGTTVNLSHNSIYLNASSTGANFSANGIYASTSSALTLRNNLVKNTSTAAGTGLVTAFRRSSTTQTTYQAASNGNLFYCGTPSATNVIYTDGTNVDQIMGDFKNRVSPSDAGSVSENPPFLSTVASSANFLKINTAIATQIESGGVAVSGITNDFEGDIRFGGSGYTGTGSAVDIGADEGNFVPTDLTAPNIVYDALGFTCTTADRTISGVVISDASGVVITGANMPRVYFKKGNLGTWFSQAGTLTAGNSSSGTWDFTISSTAMGGVSISDTVYYFVIAQDSATSGNVGANSGAGLVASSVSTISTYPSAASYTFSLNLNGTYTVGASGAYSTLSAAALAYNTSCITGPVVFSLTDANYSTNETFPVVFAQSIYGSSTNTLTIKPAASNTVTISGSSATGLIKLDGIDYATIDGSNNGSTSRDLSFVNGTAGTSVSIWNASKGGVGNGAHHNTIKNVIVEGGSGTTSGVYGIVSSSDNSLTTAAQDNDNLTVENCKVYKTYIAMSFLNNSIASLYMDSLMVINNEIGDTASANVIGAKGIQTSYNNAPIIRGNKVLNVKSSVSVNTAGIELQAGVIGGEVTKNTISGIYSTSTGGWGAYGINFSSTSLTTDVLVANNMISDIIASNYSATSTTYNAFGIRIAGGTNLKVYNNSIYMVGDVIGGTAIGMSANVIVTTVSASGLDARNNILHNAMNFANTGSNCYNIYSATTSLVVTGIDYNSYSGSSSTSTTSNVGYFGAAIGSLSAWQTATLLDANSNDITPNFVAPTDLHLEPTANFGLSNLGTPIATVSDDIDGDLRNAATPDMGADEFDVDCSTLFTITLSDTAVALCPSTPATFSATTDPSTVSAQWLLNGIAISGETNLSISATSVGNYQITLIDTVSGCVDTSNFVTVSSQLTTVVTLDPTDVTACAGISTTLSGAGVGSGALSYQWLLNGTAITGETDSTLTFSSLGGSNSGNYALEITGACNADTTLSAVILVSEVAASSAAGTIICNGDQTDITVSAANGYAPYVGTGIFAQGAGSYNFVVTDSIGCTDSTQVTLTEPAVLASTQNFTVCFGENVTVGANTYSTTGIYTDVLSSTEGCDSTVTTDLVVNAQIDASVDATESTLTSNQNGATYQWIDCQDNSAIEGATSQSYTATITGNYAVVVTIDGCSDTSACNNVIIIGIENVNVSALVKAYPNPSNGTFTLEVPMSGMYSVINQLGQVVYASYLNQNQLNTIELDAAAGVYYLMANTNGFSVSYQLLVTK